MKRNLFALAAVFIGLSTATYADDGFSELAAGGLEFQKSDAISMDKEVLEISPDRIDVSYEFKNNSSKDITATVAFPLPPIKCGGFDRSFYPDEFKTTVDDQPVSTQVEQRAFVRSDLVSGESDRVTDAGFTQGQEVTDVLKKHAIPADCRQTVIDADKAAFTKAFGRVVKLGLGSSPDEGDPYEIYYESHIKYFWQQKFPANSTVHISHSYRPAYGAGVLDIPKDYYPAYYRNASAYKQLFSSQPQLRPIPTDLGESQRREYVIVGFILKSANSWDGPIKDFQLVIKKPPCFVVTSLDGAPTLEDGDIVVHKQQFSPADDLQVFYVEDMNLIKKLAQRH